MNHTLTVSEETFAHLQRETKARGFETVEQLLEECHGGANRRREVVQRIDALREYLKDKYGTMPDSTELIREDRDR